MESPLSEMVVDYSHEAITEAAIFSRLPELPNYGIVSTETTDSHWYLDIKPTDPRTLPFFIREQDSLATAAGLIAGDFVDIVISCPKLMKGSVKTSYPKSLLVGNQKPPIQFPSSTLLFIDLVRTFGSKWSKTIADGAPYDHIEHTKPGYIHVRDYVIYRILLRAARENNVKIALLLDPVMGFAPYVEQQGPPSYFNKLCYCSNMACMRLGYPKKQCAGCRVAYYCSDKCSQADWKDGHSNLCIKIQSLQAQFGLGGDSGNRAGASTELDL